MAKSKALLSAQTHAQNYMRARNENARAKVRADLASQIENGSKSRSLANLLTAIDNGHTEAIKRRATGDYTGYKPFNSKANAAKKPAKRAKSGTTTVEISAEKLDVLKKLGLID